jgi:hypothetical protein
MTSIARNGITGAYERLGFACVRNEGIGHVSSLSDRLLSLRPYDTSAIVGRGTQCLLT